MPTPTTNPYDSRLNDLLSGNTDVSSQPWFKSGYNLGLNALNASNSAMRGSGNALAALMKFGTDYGQKGFMDYANFLQQGQNNQNQFNLGLGQNENTATRNANDYSLGQAQNANTAQRNAWDYALGQGQNAIGMTNARNNFALGQQQNANTAMNNWWNYDVNRTNANTNAGSAQSNDWWRRWNALSGNGGA